MEPPSSRPAPTKIRQAQPRQPAQSDQKIALDSQDRRCAKPKDPGRTDDQIQAIVDALGAKVELSFAPGQASDLDAALPLLEDIDPKAFLAAKAYAADALIETLEDCDIVPLACLPGPRD